MKKITTIIIILSLIISCEKNNTQKNDITNNNAENKLQVYASIYPIYDFTKK